MPSPRGGTEQPRRRKACISSCKRTAIYAATGVRLPGLGRCYGSPALRLVGTDGWHADLQDDGNFCVYLSSEKNAIWCTGYAKKVTGLLEIQGLPCRERSQPPLLISGDPKSLSNRATIQEPYKDKSEFQIFQKTDLIINNKPYGMLLVMPALKGAAILGAWPQTYSKLSFFNGFGEEQIMIKVDPGPGWPGTGSAFGLAQVVTIISTF